LKINVTIVRSLNFIVQEDTDMPTWAIVILSILAVLIGLFIALIIVGRKMQKKQAASQADIEAASQVISMLVIDKKKMRVKDANLPKMVAEQIPKYMRMAKLPLVKAKVGPKVMTLIADVKVFENLPLKTEVKVAVSGMYITEIKYVRGKVEPRQLTKRELKAKAKAEKANAKNKK
jgi:hypothetical protein